MATCERYIGASREEVFSVLANGWYYTAWVVGTSHMRAVEASWPAVGSRLFHATGGWPATIEDETEVVALDAPARLEMVAKGGPLGRAKIVLELSEEGPGSRVRMSETAVGGPGHLLQNPLTDRLLHWRNVESLNRLAALAERRSIP